MSWLSEYIVGIGVRVAAISRRATTSERNLTVGRHDGCAKGVFSMEPEEFVCMVGEGNYLRQSLSSLEFSMQPPEKVTRDLCRSGYIVPNVKGADLVSQEIVRSMRYGGRGSSSIENLLGRKFRKDLSKGAPAILELIDNS